MRPALPPFAPLIATAFLACGTAEAATLKAVVSDVVSPSAGWSALGILAPDTMTFTFTYDDSAPFSTIVRDDADMLMVARSYRLTGFHADLGSLSFGGPVTGPVTGQVYFRDGIESRDQPAGDYVQISTSEPFAITPSATLALFTMVLSAPGPDVFDGPIPTGPEMSAMIAQQVGLRFTKDGDPQKYFVSGRDVSVTEIGTVPVPAGLAMLLTGLAGLGMAGRSRTERGVN